MAPRRKGEDGLTLQEGLFVEHYLACNCNGTEAARRAGYAGADLTLAVQANRLLSRAKVQEALEKRRLTIEMSANEVLAELAKVGRLDVMLPGMAGPKVRALEVLARAHGLLDLSTRELPKTKADLIAMAQREIRRVDGAPSDKLPN